MAGNNRHKHKRYSPPEAEVKGDKETLAKSVDDIGLPEETATLLKNNKINTVYDIARRTERDMYRIQTFNRKQLGIVKASLNKLGVDFQPPREAQPTGDENRTNGNGKENGRERNGRENAGRENNAASGGRTSRPDARTDNRGVKGERRDNRQNDRSADSRNGQGKRQDAPRPEKKPKVLLPLEEWQKVCKNGKWGFSNGLTTVIEPKFDEVFRFKEGLACVDIGEKFGFIDSEGTFVIEPQYECAMSFSEGFAVIFEGEKCGYINKENQRVINCIYDAATAFENGRAKVKLEGRWQTIDTEGNVIWSK